MNHCGRPEKEKCEVCRKGFGINEDVYGKPGHYRHESCIFSENPVQGKVWSWMMPPPVQEKPQIGTAGNDMGYPTAVFTAPDAEEWEESFEHLTIVWLGTRENTFDLTWVKSFIRSQIELAEKRTWEKMSFGSPDWREFVKNIKKEERSRLSEEIEKLKRKTFQETNTFSEVQQENAWYNDAIRDVLKVLHEV